MEISDNYEVKLQEHFLAVAQFERLSVDLTGISQWNEMIGNVQSSINAMLPDITAERAIIRLELTGETELSARIHRDHDLLEEDLRLVASQCGAVHCEAIIAHTRRPGIKESAAATATSPTAAPLLELHKISLEVSTRQFVLDQEFAPLLKKLASKLPRELRDRFDTDALMDDKSLEFIFENGLETALARLESHVDLKNREI